MLELNKLLAGWKAALLAVVLLAPIVALSDEPYAQVLKFLPQSKHTLTEGIRTAAKPPAVALSAKFELDDHGRLSLSVYMAGRGLTRDARHNALREIAGNPTTTQWKPDNAALTDPGDVATATKQLALLSRARFSLLDILGRAAKLGGSPFLIAPVVRDGTPQFLVLLADNGHVVRVWFDLKTGKQLYSDAR